MTIETEKLYTHSFEFDQAGWRWSHFSVDELKCDCEHFCEGEYYHAPKFLDALEKMRRTLGAPIIINSGRRCAGHNHAVGGASQSMHTKEIAIDIKIQPHPRKSLYEAAIQCGFTGMGFGVNFMHLDMGRKRRWDYPHAIELWKKELGFNPLMR
ncbi:D-Ala-D-Ala carboxypeptidase family metallohydrolase [Pseudaquidulcibacter saccharophilus]|uniref:D-Ala-D-Ala carboxypeptidase family metallohydrolase n=1 Tax=Pseudaquidulcibacter saccharophilus TaxID=2831900 RepID=UPI001EFF0937|nr:D-Ala-D-Ala carboxypeptidase family metallohydrolase [Pseudaquidulcibacter saccharophilus]